MTRTVSETPLDLTTLIHGRRRADDSGWREGEAVNFSIHRITHLGICIVYNHAKTLSGSSVSTSLQHRRIVRESRCRLKVTIIRIHPFI